MVGIHGATSVWQFCTSRVTPLQVLRYVAPRQACHVSDVPSLAGHTLPGQTSQAAVFWGAGGADWCGRSANPLMACHSPVGAQGCQRNSVDVSYHVVPPTPHTPALNGTVTAKQ